MILLCVYLKKGKRVSRDVAVTRGKFFLYDPITDVIFKFKVLYIIISKIVKLCLANNGP